MLDGGHGGGVAAVDPTLFEVPERGDDEVVLPRRGVPVLSTTGLKGDGVTDKLQNY